MSRCNVSTHGSLPLLSFPTLGVLHCVSGSAVVLGLVRLSQRVLRAGYGYIVLLASGFCKCFFAHFALSAFCTVWSGLHCASCYSVHRCTVCARAGACARVARLTAGVLGRYGRVLGLGRYRTRGAAQKRVQRLTARYMAVWACRASHSVTAGAGSGARVDAHRGAGRVVWSVAGLGTLGAVWGRVGLDRGAGSATGADSMRGWTA